MTEDEANAHFYAQLDAISAIVDLGNAEQRAAAGECDRMEVRRARTKVEALMAIASGRPTEPPTESATIIPFRRRAA